MIGIRRALGFAVVGLVFVCGLFSVMALWVNAALNDHDRQLASMKEAVILHQQRVDPLQRMVINLSGSPLPPMKSTWYGNYRKGRRTANGELFDKRAWTCAHRTLPFGAVLLLELNGRETLVRVNDRGPEKWTGKDIDITERAAEDLGFKRAGTATLKVRRLL